MWWKSSSRLESRKSVLHAIKVLTRLLNLINIRLPFTIFQLLCYILLMYFHCSHCMLKGFWEKKIVVVDIDRSCRDIKLHNFRNHTYITRYCLTEIQFDFKCFFLVLFLFRRSSFLVEVFLFSNSFPWKCNFENFDGWNENFEAGWFPLFLLVIKIFFFYII